jgi:DNA-binding MarR family transcriptional regulator
MEGVDGLSADAFRALMRTLHLHRRLMMQVLGDIGAHPAQAMCLRWLAMEDGLAQKDLADTMSLTPPTVSRMLKSMGQAGVIERRPDDQDQRLTRVYLTDEGRRRERELRAITAEHVAETFGTLPEADRRELTRLLDGLSTSLERAAERRSGEAAT